MKIRQGFVSNSSSSSFIVWFPKNDKTINNEEEFKQKLIDEGYGMIRNYVDNNCYDGFDEVISNMGGQWFEWEDY